MRTTCSCFLKSNYCALQGTGVVFPNFAQARTKEKKLGVEFQRKFTPAKDFARLLKAKTFPCDGGGGATKALSFPPLRVQRKKHRFDS